MALRAGSIALGGLVLASTVACGTSPDDGPDSPSGGTSSGGSTGSGGASGGGGLGGSGPSSGAGAIDCRIAGDGLTTLAFVNHCGQTLEFAGSDIAGGTLAPGEHECVDIGSDTESLSAKRYWAWVGEDPGAEHHSLAEFTFNTDFYDFDWYNISFVDAFNLPLQIVPVAKDDCDTLTCAEDLLPDCPEVGRSEDSSGTVTSCVSPNRNDPESPVALYFEQCDDAYAWSGDDQEGDDPSPVKACAGEDWDIVLCPEP